MDSSLLFDPIISLLEFNKKFTFPGALLAKKSDFDDYYTVRTEFDVYLSNIQTYCSTQLAGSKIQPYCSTQLAGSKIQPYCSTHNWLDLKYSHTVVHTTGGI